MKLGCASSPTTPFSKPLLFSYGENSLGVSYTKYIERPEIKKPEIENPIPEKRRILENQESCAVPRMCMV